MRPEPSSIVIAKADERHLEGMIALHARAFPQEFLTLLGAGVLRSFYGFYGSHQHGISLVAMDGRRKTVVGLVCGGEPSLRPAFVRRHAVRLALDSIRGCLRHRRVRTRLWQYAGAAAAGLARRRPDSSAAGPGLPAPTPCGPPIWSSLLSICTDPGHRGGGIGRLLMDAFREESLRRGYSLMRLSVHNDNTAAINLYRRCGWAEIRTTATGTYFQRTTGA